MLRISQASTPADIDTIRTLLLEYQAGLGVDLCFQNFQAELARLPGAYSPPDGCLLIAANGGAAVGCVALQPVDTSRCEMKRLYVRPGARGLGVGRKLVSIILENARAMGYQQVVLDTLPTMVEAQRLYQTFGFHPIPAYRANPVIGAQYLARSLSISPVTM